MLNMIVNKDGLKSIATYLLLIFIFVSIGFMLGKNSVNRQDSQTINKNIDFVAVYYMHSTFRCETCNTIETMTRNLLDRQYSSFLEDGSIQWQDIDFMKDIDLSKQFDVAASCVVVADIQNGEVIDFQRLNEVWTLMKDPEAFDQHISDAIDIYLSKEVRK